MGQIKRWYFSRSPLIIAGIFLGQCFLWVGTAAAQGNVELRMNDVHQSFCPDLQKFVVTVVNENKAPLDRQAVVKLHDKKRNIDSWDTTESDSTMTFCSIDFGDYEIDASAVGYLTEHKDWTISGAIGNMPERNLQLVMHKDPTAVELSAPDSAIPAAARKEVKRAVVALRSANFKDAQKLLDKALKLAPSNAQINFLYGYLYFQQKNFAKAEEYLSRATTLDPSRVQPLALLGRAQLEHQEYESARKTLEQAVVADSNYWMAHYLLGDAYLQLKEYDKAREQAQLAIDKGRGAGNIAQLVLGQALANLGRDQEGIAALKIFVQTNPSNTAIAQVKALIVKIENRDAGLTSAPGTEADTDLALAASAPSLPESAWGPPGVDEVKPPVAPGVTCPYQQVMEGSGERVRQFVDNIAKFAAVEDMVHEQLDKTGNPITKETRKFTYVASITEAQPGFLQTDEYRNLRYGITDLPDHIVTSGSMSLALIFHPDMRDNFEMACEGLGDWHGQSAWLVHFRQRDDKPNTFAEYYVGSQHYPMNMKGRAWITTDNLQIVQVDAELVKPLPQLAVQHQIAEYGPVHFQKRNLDLWLPKNADTYLELNRHYYHRRHSYDHYMLFSVDSVEKAGLIKSGDKSPVIKDAVPSAPIIHP
ncbi:MAG: tetratricopeptide repeat protein [Candidatus Sulfotelmatobacter sp.]